MAIVTSFNSRTSRIIMTLQYLLVTSCMYFNAHNSSISTQVILFLKISRQLSLSIWERGYSLYYNRLLQITHFLSFLEHLFLFLSITEHLKCILSQLQPEVVIFTRCVIFTTLTPGASCSDDGGSTLLSNIGRLLRDWAVQYPRRLSFFEFCFSAGCSTWTFLV